MTYIMEEGDGTACIFPTLVLTEWAQAYIIVLGTRDFNDYQTGGAMK